MYDKFALKTNDVKLIPMIKKIIISLLGVGFIKPASATWGSLAAAIALYFTFPLLTTIPIKIGIILITFTLGTILSNQVEKKERLHDPHFIVIDELVGMMIVCFFLEQIWWHFAIAFVLFRIFDIAKLWPASIFDRKKGGFSLMIDDVIMAIPALASLHIIIYYV